MIKPATIITFVLYRFFFLLSLSIWIKHFFSSSSAACLICSIASNADKWAIPFSHLAMYVSSFLFAWAIADIFLPHPWSFFLSSVDIAWWTHVSGRWATAGGSSQVHWQIWAGSCFDIPDQLSWEGQQAASSHRKTKISSSSARLSRKRRAFISYIHISYWSLYSLVEIHPRSWRDIAASFLWSLITPVHDDVDSLFCRLLYEAAYVLYAFPYQILLSISKAFDRRAKKREISRIFWKCHISSIKV